MPSSRITNVINTLRLAFRGIGLRNKLLLFYLAAFGSLNPERRRHRNWLLKRINSFGDGMFLDLRFWVNERVVIFSLRQGNDADYLVASELLREAYKTPDFTPTSIVDGGANIGLFTCAAAARFPDAELRCFEPDPANFKQLQRNLQLNHLRADCKCVGLWSKTTTLYYHARRSHTGFVSEEVSDIAIPCVRPSVGQNCWLKLDIETAEYEVLPALLASGDYPRWISMEIHHYSERGRVLTDLLTRHNYEIEGGEDYSAQWVNISAKHIEGCLPPPL